MLQTRVALALVAVLLAACARGAGSPGDVPTPSDTPSQTASPSPTPEPTPRATPTPTPIPTPVATPSPTPDAGTDAPALVHGELAEVLIDGLNVREAAGESSPVITISYGDYNNLHTVPLQLDSGERVLILDGPVAAGGRWWFRIATGDPLMPPQSVFIGWSAAGTVSDPWLRAAAECAPNPDVAALSVLRYIERLGCYGSDPLSFDAVGVRFLPSAGMGGACQTEPGAPTWLLCDNVNYSYVRPVNNESVFFLLHFDPNGPQPWVDPLTLQDVPVRITGHHADPAAQDCGIGLDEPAAEVFRLQCATLFVVDSLEVIE